MDIKGNIRSFIAAFCILLFLSAVTIAETKPCCGTDACTCIEAKTVDEAVKAPDFTLTDINGKEVTLSSLKGKIVVLEWMNYDCPFVKPHYERDTSTMKNLAHKYKDNNVVWLTINSTNYATPESNKEWAQKHELKHQHVLIDQDGKVGKLYDAKTTPHIFIVDKKGHIAYQGAIDNAPRGQVPEGQEYVNYADQALEELTSGKSVTVSKTKPYGCSVKYAKS